MMLFLLILIAIPAAAADTQALELFEKSVRPVLAQRCYQCHGDKQQFGGLRADSRDRLLRGGNRGPSIASGDPEHSLLMKALRHDGALKMPPDGKLSTTEIAAVEKWIQAGAPWPEKEKSATLGPGDPGYYDHLLKEHWAFQPVTRQQGTVDSFIRAKLKEKGLKPAPPASREALVRRASFALTGLPPTPLEVDLFARDQKPGAYERLIDRLLASPHFGEHWARHWMDVVRFGETLGNDWNYEFPGAWRYRDYLIRAFNADVPYNQLVREHIAGDLLAKPRISNGINESIIGTASIRLGEQGHDDCMQFREVRTDVVDNQIDTIGKAFLGLTIACARCHDHKLDPIPTADYYSMYGMLTSSRLVMRTADVPAANASKKAVLSAKKPQIRALLSAFWAREASLLSEKLLAADRVWRKAPPTEADVADPSRFQALTAALEKKGERDLSDPLSPWMEMSRAANWNAAWTSLGSRYSEESKTRAAYNREQFVPFGDFRRGLSGWRTDGTAQIEGASPAGEFSVEPVGDKAVTGVYRSGIYTHALSQRLNASLWSPLVPKDKKFVSVQVVGGRLGARRQVVDNCMLSEEYEGIDTNSFVWMKSPTRYEYKDLPYYIELVTKSDNPRYPERPGRLFWPRPEELDQPYSYFGVARAVLHDVDATPKEELTHLADLLAKPSASREELAKAYAARLQNAIARWAEDKATDDDARWIQWALDRNVLTNSVNVDPELRALIEDYRSADARIQEPTVFHSIADLDPGYDVPVFVSGNPRNFGKVVPRGGTLHMLSKYAGGDAREGSGRLQAANLIASQYNPLTARVMANRIWHHLFGRGIVPTTDNFGKYGEAPSHLELIDYLAGQFVSDGWSMKKLIREIALSETFQQSSASVAEAASIDPENRLLHRYPVRRLEAESIRDAILATSGRLDRKLYGKSIEPYRTEQKEYRKLFKGPLDGLGRRSIYLKVTRHEGPPFLEIFDFPQPMVPRGTRDVTNVPPQALALMNDPFVLDQANYWAGTLVGDKASNVEERIDAMFRQAFGRESATEERQRFAGMAAELASLHKVDKDKVLTNRTIWKDVAHSMFLQKEFIYLR